MGHRTDAGTLPAETHVGRTALRVGAIDELTAFYRDVVGLQVQERTDASATLGAGDEPLLVLEADADAPVRHRAAGLYHNAFRVPSRSALGDALVRIREHWELDGASDHGVSEALYCTDPAGNGVEVYRDFPRSDWPRTEAGRVDIGTEHLDLGPIEAGAGSDEQVPPGTDVGHVHLAVSSLDAVESFYGDVLGLELVARMPGALFLAAGGYHHHVGANTWEARMDEAGGRGLSWFELVVPDADALEAVRDRLEAAGVAVEHVGETDEQAAETDEHVGETDVREMGEGLAVTDHDGIEVRLRAES